MTTQTTPDVNDIAIASALGGQTTQPASQPSGTPAPDVNDMAIASALGKQPAQSTQPSQPSIGDRVWDAAKGMVTQIINPPQTHTEEGIAMIGGPTALAAWRAAKGVVDSAKSMATAAADEYPQAVQDFKQSVEDYHNKNYTGLAADATSAASDVAGIANPTISGPANEVRQYAQDTKPGGNLAGDLTRGAIGAGAALAAPEVMAEEAPEVAGAESATDTAAANETSAATPASAADTVAATNAAKASITPGVEAQTEAPTVESLQPQIQQNLRDTINTAAKDEGLQEIPASTSIRDLGKALGDQFFARSKATFAAVKDATGIDLNDLADKISTLSDKIDDAIDNPEKAGQLEQQKAALENKADAAFNQAKNAGVDPEQAREDWKKFNASYDFGKQVRAATDGRVGIGAGEVVDPNKLAPRLQKMADSNSPTQPGRLQQFLGDNHTTTLLNNIEQGRGAIQDFTPSTATGQKALQDLIRQNTGVGWKQSAQQAVGMKPSTNWIGTYGKFNDLSPAERAAQFGSEAPKVDAFLKSQARLQLGKFVAKGMAGAAIAHLTGVDKDLLTFILAEHIF